MQPCPGLNQLGIIGVSDMGFLRVIRKWALRDKMPMREIARRYAQKLVTPDQAAA